MISPKVFLNQISWKRFVKGLLDLVAAILAYIGLDLILDCVFFGEDCAKKFGGNPWSTVYFSLVAIFALTMLYVYGVSKSSTTRWKNKRVYLLLKEEVTPAFVWTLILFGLVGLFANFFSSRHITDQFDYYIWNMLVLLCLSFSYQTPAYRGLVNWFRMHWK